MYKVTCILDACLRLITRSRSKPLAQSCFVLEDTAAPVHSTTCHTLETKFPAASLASNTVILKLFYIINHTIGDSLMWVFKLKSLDFKGFVSPEIVSVYWVS